MPTPIYLETFDGSSSLPTGWNWPAEYSIATGVPGITPISGANVLEALTNRALANYATWQTLDGVAGAVRASAYFVAGSLTAGNTVAVGVQFRQQSASPGQSGGTCYLAQLDLSAGAVSLSGSAGQLGPTVTLPGVAASQWYWLAAAADASDLVSVWVQRYSDGYWAQPGGTWAAAQAACISLTDPSPIVGQGYSGVYAATGSDPAYVDNFGLDALTGAPALFLPRPQFLPPGRPVPPRGRALIVGMAPAPPAPASPLRGPSVASPRRLPGGRAWLPAPIPPTPPPMLPLRGLSIAVAPGGRDRAGRAWLSPSPPAASDQLQTPLVAAIRPVGSPRRPIGGRSFLPAGTRPVGPPDATPLGGLLVRLAGQPTPFRPRGSAWLPTLSRSASDQGQTPLVGIVRPAGLIVTPRMGLVRFHGIQPRLAPAAQPSPLPAVAIVRRAGEDLIRRLHPGSAWAESSPRWPASSNPRPPFAGVWYDVYGSPAPGQPIAYDAPPLAVVQALTWTSGPMAIPGTWGFGVRAANASGEELNLDCSVYVTLDADGRDVSNVPSAPIGLRAYQKAGAKIVVEFAAGIVTSPSKRATSFLVYMTAGNSMSWTTPAATVNADAAILGAYQVTLQGVDETTYLIGVRAVNASGEEPNTATVSCVADGAGPGPVLNLSVTLKP